MRASGGAIWHRLGLLLGSTLLSLVVSELILTWFWPVVYMVGTANWQQWRRKAA